MSRTPNRSTYAKAADKTFRHGVDNDLTGAEFSAALTWVADRQLTNWDIKHGADVAGRCYQFAGRYYFPDRETAEAFQKAFGGRRWSLADLSERQMLIAKEREIARDRSADDCA
ncbi:MULTISPECIES: hypothetical protein [Pseudomonadota]|uniref:hypothetical protein n=1 Tax=Pseudomonadota TaxID=1224 RepID=UPI00186967FE|nr:MULTISPECIES: hypothetical protein [Pseudomonadota]